MTTELNAVGPASDPTPGILDERAWSTKMAACFSTSRPPTSLHMLNLQSISSERWLQQVASHLDQILIDHAHCEKKAAGCAMNLLFAYIENQELCRAMTVIVNEELEHFHQVLDILAARGIRFRRLKPGPYGRKLNDLVRKFEPDRAVDRLLRQTGESRGHVSAG